MRPWMIHVQTDIHTYIHIYIHTYVPAYIGVCIYEQEFDRLAIFKGLARSQYFFISVWFLHLSSSFLVSLSLSVSVCHTSIILPFSFSVSLLSLCLCPSVCLCLSVSLSLSLCLSVFLCLSQWYSSFRSCSSVADVSATGHRICVCVAKVSIWISPSLHPLHLRGALATPKLPRKFAGKAYSRSQCAIYNLGH